MGAGFAGFESLATLDYSELAELVSLLVLPFAHEELAIILGAYLISSDALPVVLVGTSIYGGMVASDFALYGLGVGARRLPWLNRYADGRVKRFSESLKRNMFGLVALCRVVPGIVFVAFVACGWARVPLSRFIAASLVVSAFYLPLTLYLTITFGDALDDQIGWLAWPSLLAVLVIAGVARQRVFAFGDAVELDKAAPPARASAKDHRGMPALTASDRRIAPAEKIPPALFYIPLVLSWIWLGIRHRSLTLPSAANPNIPAGGMWGEAKSDYFRGISGPERSAIAAHAVLVRGANGASVTEDCARALQLMAAQGLAFPLIVKPDIGWHGYGVQLVHDCDQLAAYLSAFPESVALMLQRFVSHDGEAAILYVRMPGEARGRIESLTLRYFPHVVGNGYSTLIGNQRAGGLYRDGRAHVTDALQERIDAVARAMPDFHYGRFDLRFEALEALMRGEDFEIVDINGIGGEAIDAWDASLPVWQTYRRLYARQKLLFEIGARNRARGVTPMPAAEFLAMLRRQTELIQLYPATE